MTSQIDITKPVYGTPTTQSVRDNFATASTEISALQADAVGAPFMPAAGGIFKGPIQLYNDPTSAMMPVTLQYAQTNFGAPGGAPAVPEAPSGGPYGRGSGAWVPVLALAGGTACQMTGELLLAGNPADALGAVPRQYADAIATTANGALSAAGGTMTGPLVLAGDASANLNPVSFQQFNAALALKAPLASPSFSPHIFVTAAPGPGLILNDTTAGRPVFGISNNNAYLSFGLANATTGLPNGNPFLTLDQTGAAIFNAKVTVTATTPRLIVTGNAGQPSVAVIDTSQTGGAGSYGMTSQGGNLLFSQCDGGGTPIHQLMYMNPTNAVFYGGVVSNVGRFSAAAAGDNACFCVINSSGVYSWGMWQQANQLQFGTCDGAGNPTQEFLNLQSGLLTVNGSITLTTNINTGNAVYVGVQAGAGSNYYLAANSGLYFINFNSWRLNYTVSNGFLSYTRYDGTTLFYIDGSGNVYAAGGFNGTNISDKRTKKNLAPYDRGLADIVKLAPVSWQFNGEGGTQDDGKTHYGLTAQDAQEHAPELVYPTRLLLPEDDAPDWRLPDQLSLDPAPLTFAYINAFREIEARLRALEGKA